MLRSVAIRPRPFWILCTMTRLGLLFVAIVAVGCGSPAPPPAPLVPADSPEVVQVQEVVSEQIGLKPEEVGPELTFAELGADGLDFVSIVKQAEQDLGVSISVETLEKVTGVSDPKDMPATLTVRQFAEVMKTLKESGTDADPAAAESEPVKP